MNLKYYLRGLGIGIVVSTLIVGIAANQKTETLSDEEIKIRAAELGMVETSGVLADDIPSATDMGQEEAAAVPTDTPKPVKEESPEEAVKEEPAKPSVEEEPTEKPMEEEPTAAPAEETPTEKPMKEDASEAEEAEITPSPDVDAEIENTTETTANVEQEEKTVMITVKSGDGSYSVCKKLEEAGLVQSATAYDTFLYEKGYDKRIVAATHEIPVGADEEQIAKILTGKN